MIFRARTSNEQAITELRGLLELRSKQLKEYLSAFKLETARTYAAINDVKDVELRIVQHLLRIEEKLDKLADAVASIARVEEKIYASTKRIDRHEFRMDTLETDIVFLKSNVAGSNKSLTAIERFVWICISTVATATVYFIK